MLLGAESHMDVSSYYLTGVDDFALTPTVDQPARLT